MKWRKIAPLLFSVLLGIPALAQDGRGSDASLAEAEEAVRVSEQQRGPDDPETATRIARLAMLYREDGQYPKALVLLERALAIREKLLGSDDPATAEILDNLAWVYLDMTEYAKGLALSLRALAAREKMLGADHPDTATSVFTTARLYREMGEYTKVPQRNLRATRAGPLLCTGAPSLHTGGAVRTATATDDRCVGDRPSFHGRQRLES